MTGDTLGDGPPPAEPPTGREVGLALGLLYGGTLVLGLLSLVVPGLVSLQQAILAGMLLVIPSFVLRRYAAPLTIDDLGVGMGPWARTAKVSIATMVVVFSLFAVGFHLLQVRWNGARAIADPGRLMRWGESVERAPANVCLSRDDQVRVWFDRGGMWVLGPPDQRLVAQVATGPTEAPRVGRALKCGPRSVQPHPTQALRATEKGFEVPQGAGLWLPLPDQRAVRMTMTLRSHLGGEQEVQSVLTGRFEQSASADPLEFQRSVWWILTYIIVHLGLVALPEEWFFRGYLQPRLDQRFGTPLTLFGAKLGWGVVVSAAAFAILHPILIPGVYRLAVFFPALLFGWLRAKTGNIGAAVVVHACANLLQATLSRFYV